MRWRWLRCRWLWLAVCIVAGSLAFAIQYVLALHHGKQIADDLSSVLRAGLIDAGFPGPPRESRSVSVSFLFGLVKVRDTSYPYLWSAVGGIVTGGGLGALVWVASQAGLWAWRRRRRAPERTAEP